MKQFFKFTLASALGTILVFVIGFFFLMGMLISSISSLSSESTPTIVENSILRMKFDYEITDRTNTDEFGLSSFDFAAMKGKDNTGMYDIIKNIRRAAEDPKITGIYLDISQVATSTAILQEIRKELVDFKKSGKFIVSYSETYTQGAYYLASVADKIYINPSGMLDLHGMASQIMFYKNMLDKLDIDVQIIRGPNNKFKSAVEPYFLDKMSEANREQMERLLNSVWFEIVSEISESRNISVERLNEIADNLETYFDAEAALTTGLVDGLRYKDEIIEELKTLSGCNDKLHIVENGEYSRTENISSSKNEVAIIYAVGEIRSGEGSSSVIGSESLSRSLRKAREDKNIKAVVMRVNSPGGSALASEVIRREVELTLIEKPLIVSMGGYAASGGYWISANADRIFADPTTLTGSIGVFGLFPNLQGFMNNKIGLTFDVAKTNKNADFGTLMQPLTETQHMALQQNVVKTYNDFTTLVAENRNLRQSYVDSIGQGRVWSGVDAIEIGLVDELGGLDNAIDYAAKLAGIENDYKVVELPKQKDIFTQLLESGNKDKEIQNAIKTKMGPYYHYFEVLEQLSNTDEIQARLPFNMSIQ